MVINYSVFLCSTTLLLCALVRSASAQENQEEAGTMTIFQLIQAEEGIGEVTESTYGITGFGRFGLSLGAFQDQLSDYNFGSSLQLDTRIKGIPFEVYGELGFTSYNSAVSTLTSLSGLNFGIGGGYPLLFVNVKNLALIPAFYIGGNLYFSNGVYSGTMQSKTVFDTYQKLSAHFVYSLDQTSSLYFTPYFMIIPDAGVTALIQGFALGYRYKL